MDVKELRIGNYVSYMGETNCMVTNIGSYGFETVKDDNIGNLYGSTYIEDYKPIPLTEQWLLDFRFKKPAHSFIGDVFHLSEWDEYPNNWCVVMNKNNAIIFKRLKHVHQLQNLYFALTGEELKLNK